MDLLKDVRLVSLFNVNAVYRTVKLHVTQNGPNGSQTGQAKGTTTCCTRGADHVPAGRGEADSVVTSLTHTQSPSMDKRLQCEDTDHIIISILIPLFTFAFLTKILKNALRIISCVTFSIENNLEP